MTAKLMKAVFAITLLAQMANMAHAQDESAVSEPPMPVLSPTPNSVAAPSPSEDTAEEADESDYTDYAADDEDMDF